ncbi:DUF975 family protein [Paenibacillus radicis (ex Xue et al. 2023)]|uniref:DUF975 family protein n=1 Tax=Paenibacillus radicis (ex Xue et al. 2023) TaxID=2972489 RepID=A0ABT1YRV6_9BACL|nr:DUF975 family protein [Paenibacillus radicis (ex Xue et al. 2023)]MCR8634725.1 DUF975 family protein [Paenibacillus radicis (ex Xue et al. 2023)]
MWDRKILKARAKDVLRLSYWKAFLVSLIVAFVGGSSSGSFNFNYNRPSSFHSPGNEDFPLLVLIIIIIVAVAVIVFALGFRIFLGFPLEVGGRRYFSQAAQSDVNMNYLGYAFTKTRYLDIIKAMFWRAFLTFLWFLLLIIPGIVKTYAYSLVPYILGDNPNIGYKRAVELSKNMTAGQKFDMFVLDLSFIGWYLLGVLALFVGVLFVMPYENATKAELYLALRQNALDEGICSYDELRLNRPIIE